MADDDTPEERPARSGTRDRRISVSAETLDPADATAQKVVHPKTSSQRERIAAAIKNNFLFGRLDKALYDEVVDAMFEKTVTKGEELIKQNTPGDNFYVVESGTFDVLVSRGGAPAVKVVSYTAGAAFGELALMYNAPRAATVVATSNAVCWALDRVSFRRVLLNTTLSKRRTYEAFLEEVPLLKELEPYERIKIADAIETEQFADGQVIIKQGDRGTTFYIIEEGEARVSQADANGTVRELPPLKKGQYFGELALLTDRPRVATITAKGPVKCISLNEGAFTRLLGPCLDILKRNTAAYEKISKESGLA